MSSYTLIANALKIHQLIFNRRDGESLTKPGMAEQLEISEKQVASAMDFLNGMGYPAAYDEKSHSWFYDWTPADRHALLADELIPKLKAFPKADFSILLMLHHGLEFLKGTRLYTDAKQFSDLFNDDRLSMLNTQVRSMFSYQSRPAQLLDDECFEAVASAIYAREGITFHYQKPEDREPMVRNVEPHHLTCSDEMWYLMGWDKTRDAMRTFALTRMQKVKRTGTSFHPLPKATIDEQLEHAFKMVGKGGKTLPHRVRLRFDAFASALVRERRWHTSQEITPLPDGCSEVSLEVASLTEVERWVLSWGGNCQVLEPAELVERVCKGARAILSKYES